MIPDFKQAVAAALFSIASVEKLKPVGNADEDLKPQDPPPTEGEGAKAAAAVVASPPERARLRLWSDAGVDEKAPYLEAVTFLAGRLQKVDDINPDKKAMELAAYLRKKDFSLGLNYRVAVEVFYNMRASFSG